MNQNVWQLAKESRPGYIKLKKIVKKRLTKGIYVLENLVSHKVYVGCSKDINLRCWQHTYLLKNNKHVNLELQKDFNTYGEDKFEFRVLEIVADIHDLYEIEKQYIKAFQNKYNIANTR